MEIQNTALIPPDAGEAAVFERRQRDMKLYQTRYVYLPFQDGHVCPQVGSVPHGAIHPIPAPKGICNVKLLPNGAQTLQVVSPSQGIPDPRAAGRPRHDDPVIAHLLEEIEKLKKMALDTGREPPNLAVYLHEVAPIVHALVTHYAPWGAIEVKSLAGVPSNKFAANKINDLLFGPEGKRPVSAKAICAQMARVIERANSLKSENANTIEGAETLRNVAGEIIQSVATCEAKAKEYMRLRHLEMEDPQDTNPKRYSKCDLRAIEFIEGLRREEFKAMVEAETRQTAQAMTGLLAQQVERDRRQEERDRRQEERDHKMMEVFSEMISVLKGTVKPQSETPQQ